MDSEASSGMIKTILFTDANVNPGLRCLQFDVCCGTILKLKVGS